MKVRLARGTNPSLKFKVHGVGLTPVFDRDGSKDHSYATIRRRIEAREEKLSSDELQIKATDSKTTDSYGNVLEIGDGFARLSLSREYTKSMVYDQYSLQFNLIDSQGRLFTHKPILIDVLYDIARFTE